MHQTFGKNVRNITLVIYRLLLLYSRNPHVRLHLLHNNVRHHFAHLCHDKQVLCTKWNGAISETLSASNGVKAQAVYHLCYIVQYLQRYSAGQLDEPDEWLISMGTICIAYADDTALLCHSIEGLQTIA